jgi:hypothetical protein
MKIMENLCCKSGFITHQKKQKIKSSGEITADRSIWEEFDENCKNFF